MTSNPTWMQITNSDEVASPALLIYPDRVVGNLQQMIALAGNVERLRPHVKTHKLPQILALQRAQGITKFKASTLAEVEMCALGDAPDVLLAYPLVGPQVTRFVDLVQRYPKTRLSCLVDDSSALSALSLAASAKNERVDVMLDLNVGMNRTGVVPGPEAAALYEAMVRLPGIRPAGLHVYDGHLQQADRERLAVLMEEAYAPVWAMRDRLLAAGFPVPRIVAGGTSTFGLLAQLDDVELGAGTPVFWDFGQGLKSHDLTFLCAAVLLIRVISRPAPNRLCLDLGHKAVASEMPHPRVKLLGLEDATFVIHSEEHLVVETPRASEFPVGTVIYGLPRHVCPTVALHSEVFAVQEGRAAETWSVVARSRKVSV